MILSNIEWLFVKQKGTKMWILLLPFALLSSYANTSSVWPQNPIKVFKGNTKVSVNGKKSDFRFSIDWTLGVGVRGREKKKVFFWFVGFAVFVCFCKYVLACIRQQKHIHAPLYPVSSASGFLPDYPQACEHPRAECTALHVAVTWLQPQYIKYQRAPRAAGSLSLSVVDLWCLHLLSSTCQHIKL